MRLALKERLLRQSFAGSAIVLVIKFDGAHMKHNLGEILNTHMRPKQRIALRMVSRFCIFAGQGIVCFVTSEFWVSY